MRGFPSIINNIIKLFPAYVSLVMNAVCLFGLNPDWVEQADANPDRRGGSYSKSGMINPSLSQCFKSAYVCCVRCVKMSSLRTFYNAPDISRMHS